MTDEEIVQGALKYYRNHFLVPQIYGFHRYNLTGLLDRVDRLIKEVA